MKKVGILKIEAVGNIVDKFPEGHANAGMIITDTTGKENSYRTVRFSVASEFDAMGREIISSAKPRNRNIWKNTNPDLFDKVRPGMLLRGNIITQEVEPYEINDRTVTTVTCIQFEDETEKQAVSATGRRNRLVKQATNLINSTLVVDELSDDLGSKA